MAKLALIAAAVPPRLTVADIAVYGYTHVAARCDYDLATFPAIRAWLRRLEQIDGGRIPQWVARPAEGPIRYEQPHLRRTLLLTVSRVDTVPGFDASIWR